LARIDEDQRQGRKTMAGEAALSHEELLCRLQSLAEWAVRRYALPATVTLQLINLSENATYRVDEPATGSKWALRVHREGYHSRTAIASEPQWQTALKASGAAMTPTPIRGKDGEFIQTVAHEGLPRPRNVALFAWEEGQEPAATDAAGFETLGEIAARMHAHVRAWQRPPWFERHTWDFETSLGERPHWGRWQGGMGITGEALETIGETVRLVERRLGRFGKTPDRFNLIHGDMRLANLLMDRGTIKVIDFDDCGFSWFLYDCATTVSFFEHNPEVPELLEAWVRGYRRVGTLSAEEEAEIDTFVMLRRLLLVAWIGSHSETELAQSMGVAYTQGTLPMCERYLSRFGEARRR
jgi:Ser/Thr protein kinase RdoA (MazF antagonist)